MAKSTRNRRAWRSAERRDGRNPRVGDRGPDQRDVSGNGAAPQNGRATDGAATPARPREKAEAGPGANGRRTNGRAGADGAAVLTPEQVKRIEQRLLQEREQALRTLVGTRTDIQRHPISDMRKEEMDIHLAERHSEFLTLIDSALRRLRESPADFHLSVVSGRPIPFERLEMVPWTRRLTGEMGLPARWSES